MEVTCHWPGCRRKAYNDFLLCGRCRYFLGRIIQGHTRRTGGSIIVDTRTVEVLILENEEHDNDPESYHGYVPGC